MKADSDILHASCVTWQGRGLLILGASGSGKSSLALELMALGCTLVADDRTEVHWQNETLVATCPDSIRGRIEARGLGILPAQSAASTGITCAVAMDQTEQERLPPRRYITLGIGRVRIFHNAETKAFPAAILQYLKQQAAHPTYSTEADLV